MHEQPRMPIPSERRGRARVRGGLSPFPPPLRFPFTFSAKSFAWRCGLIFVLFSLSFSFFGACFCFSQEPHTAVGSDAAHSAAEAIYALVYGRAHE